jgi:hypothetical protein
MSLVRRVTVNSVAGRLVAAGASREDADAIVGALLGCGLTAPEAREWLEHENRSYPIQSPVMLSQTPIVLVERGDTEHVLSAALEFAEAAPEERTIARLYGGDIQAARRLTRNDPRRTAVIAGIATTLLKRLGSPERVCYATQTRLPGHGDLRIVDRLLGEHARA